MTWETSYGPYVKLIVTATESEVNIATNTSKVTVNAELYFPGTPSAHNAWAQTLVVDIDGTRVATVTGITYSLGSKASKNLGTWSKVVTHNQDGKKNAAIYVNINDFHGDVGTVSQSLGLTDIPRLSTPTLSDYTKFVGDTIRINTNRNSSAFTHTITFKVGDNIYHSLATGVNDTIDWEIPDIVGRSIKNTNRDTVTIRVETFNGSISLGTKTVSFTAWIPRSIPTLSHSTRKIGETLKINTNSKVSTLGHRIIYRVSGGIWHTVDTDIVDFVNWTVTDRVAYDTPYSNANTVYIAVETYNGTYNLGTETILFTGEIPYTEEFNPTFNTISHTELVSEVATKVGAYVQNKSKLKLTITGAVNGKGALTSGYEIKFDRYTINGSTGETGFLRRSGNEIATATFRDTRGRIAEKEVTINILPYSAPTLSNLSFRRTLPDKTEAPLGDNVTVRANVKVQSLIVNGVEKNSIRYNVQSAQSGGSFADKANTTATSLTKSYSDVWSGYSVDYSYNFRVRAGDIFDWTGWSVGVVPTGIVTQQWGSKTTSFGKMIDDTSYNVQVGLGGIDNEGDYYKGGVPLIDRVGNVDFCTKLPDGTMICRMGKLVYGSDKKTDGQGINFQDTTFNFPEPFMGVPYREGPYRISVQPSFTYMVYEAGWAGVNSMSRDTTIFTIDVTPASCIVTLASKSGLMITPTRYVPVSIIAVGRWK